MKNNKTRQRNAFVGEGCKSARSESIRQPENSNNPIMTKKIMEAKNSSDVEEERTDVLHKFEHVQMASCVFIKFSYVLI